MSEQEKPNDSYRQTRQQTMLDHALRHVSDVKAKEDLRISRIYGGLCHKFPVLIRTCGLCQTLAFVESKCGSGDKPKKREEAYRMLRDHALETLREEKAVSDKIEPLIEQVRKMPTRQYTLASRVLLYAWVYYKRFAESVLDVKPGEGEDEDDD